MRTTRNALLGFHFAVILLAPNAIAGGVRIVDPVLGATSFPTPQAAIDAAPDGAILLIAAGTYPGFTITGRSISLFAVPGATVNIHRAVLVSGISSSQTVVLAGLNVVPDINDADLAAITVADCIGSVRVESSALHSWDYLGIGDCFTTLHQGAPSAIVSSSQRVVFRACTMLGGHGEALASDNDCGTCGRADGGAGLEVHGAAPIVMLYDCTLQGGTGGAAECEEGRGGAGLELNAGTAFASACTFLGGRGGDNIEPGSPCGGSGGDGVAILGTVPFALIDCSSAGGAPGFPGVPCGAASVPYQGGTLYVIPGPAARAAFPVTVVSDLRPVSIAFHGGSIDIVTLLLGTVSPPVTVFGPRGPLLVGGDLVNQLALGQVRPDGSLDTGFKALDLPGNSGPRRSFVQVSSRGVYGTTLGTAATLLILNRLAPPDCDLNGVNDFVQMIEDPAQDANHNLIPDSCPGG